MVAVLQAHAAIEHNHPEPKEHHVVRLQTAELLGLCFWCKPERDRQLALHGIPAAVPLR